MTLAGLFDIVCRKFTKKRETERLRQLFDSYERQLVACHLNEWEESGWMVIQQSIAILDFNDPGAAQRIREKVALWRGTPCPQTLPVVRG